MDSIRDWSWHGIIRTAPATASSWMGSGNFVPIPSLHAWLTPYCLEGKALESKASVRVLKEKYFAVWTAQKYRYPKSSSMQSVRKVSHFPSTHAGITRAAT